MDKRCGTCKWWRLLFDGTGEWAKLPAYGACDYPLPIALRRAMRETNPTDGTACPVWQQKETRDE